MRDFLSGLKLLGHGKAMPLGMEPILIYGAGNKGKQIAAFLRDAGHDVIGLADAAASGTETWQNLKIRPLSNWRTNAVARNAILIVAIHNHRVDMAKLLAQISQDWGGRIVNTVEFQALYEGQFPDSYWLAGPNAYASEDENLIALAALLADDGSRDLLRRVVEFRLTGNYGVLPAPTGEDQYCPADLPRWAEPIRFIDAGAFDGDTLRLLKRNAYEVEQVVAFEPDPQNFARLSACVTTLGGGICLPCGVAQRTSQVHFTADGSGSSRISDQGTQIIQCVSLDEVLPGFRPTLIKMDIEGAEHEALLGAAKTIAANRPGLAISIYHHPAHLWQIPLLINSWQLDYQFHLRMHGYSTFDLVLYALPPT